MNLIVGVSDVMVSSSPADTIVTYALGSCVGLTLYDPVARVGALIHCMLPFSKTDPARAAERPAMFVDKGIIELLGKLYAMNATKKNLIACVAGGASPLDIEGSAKIGERNIMTTRKLLWKNDLLLVAEEVGGTIARTMSLDMSTGITTLKSLGKVRQMNPGVKVFAQKARV